jgi:hypothetical protein
LAGSNATTRSPITVEPELGMLPAMAVYQSLIASTAACTVAVALSH